MSETKLKKSYLDDGRERNFLVDEKGVEWFYYNDPQTKLIVRALTLEEQDIEEFRHLFVDSNIENLKKEILKINRKEDQNTDIWIFEDEKKNPICATDVTFLPDEIRIVYYYSNNMHQRAYEKNVNRTLSNIAKDVFRMSMYGAFLNDIFNKKKIYLYES